METKRLNIMTSCDDKLSKYILPQLVSIDRSLSNYDVHFYLVHSRIKPENVQLLTDFAKNKTKIIFHEIIITEGITFYSSLVENGGGQWPFETYFTLRLQDYLPEEVDRILYIDAGDIIIDGDIGPYYFDDFEDNSLIVTPLRYKKDPVSGESTLYTKDDILSVAISSFFNSGSYVINVDKFRAEGYTADDYLYLSNVLAENKSPGSLAYFGDQGFLAAAFLEDAKLFGYPQSMDSSYMPYNFVTSYWRDYRGELEYKKELDYKPVVLHYAIRTKPWTVRFSEEVIDTVISEPGFISYRLVVPIPTIALITPGHFRMAEIWWEYAKETPIYDEANTRARITADNWLEYYLPMCRDYLQTYYQLHYGSK